MVLLSTEESLICFLQKQGDNRVKRGLLLFWGMHPNAKFDGKGICYALDYGKLNIERALSTMIEEGLLDRHTSNGVILYSLTTDEEKRRPILELASLSWDRWQIMIMRNGADGQSS